MGSDDQSAGPAGAPLDTVLHVQTLFVQHMPRIRAFVLSLMPDFALADDILQDVFLTVTAKAADFRRDTNFLAWAFTIARFRVLKSMNRMDKAFLPLSAEVMECLAAEAPDVGAEQDRRIAYLEQCLKKLAPQARRVIDLRYYGALKPAAIAERLGLSVNGVSVLLSRSRTVLRECVERQMQMQRE
ncbi:MAG: sigma-70 family RNA polymerase sigma factor [Kiritimatiellae bacterium]|jgi:RNA polymerase sigma-70 factor (ECF subfamily)|nr:sigma-70 family RNA polymerase sigma factor [Kiritimatiellia bacterium]OQC24620.1 MAG: RNA polymerase sigma factor YlaC [Verrucomicrobia bacterium ADurb.Bin070]HPB12002.1 sigma-70 family RNA polymerase sigma factor [Kiritimatiellia bacterium]